MLKETLRALNGLNDVKLEVSIPTDGDGYLDRECPKTECEFMFKVFLEDWKRDHNGDNVFCPRCRHEAERHGWWTQAQADYRKRLAVQHVSRAITEGLQVDARNFNRRQRHNEFFSMEMKIKPSGERPVKQVRACELMQQKYTCPACSARYASVGIAFFCPLCGLDDAERAFCCSLETTRMLMDRVGSLRTTLSAELGDDAAVDVTRTIIEDSMGRLVGGFERYSEVMFARLPAASGIAVSRGAFQRLDDASALWAQAGKPTYDTVLPALQWQRLKVLYQRRHLLVHNAGVVDQRYLDRSGDTTYSTGQRVVVDVKDVQDLAEFLDRLARTR